jgi:hypothetical protein
LLFDYGDGFGVPVVLGPGCWTGGGPVDDRCDGGCDHDALYGWAAEI